MSTEQGYIYKIIDTDTDKLRLPVTVSDAVYVGDNKLTNVLENLAPNNSLRHLYIGKLENLQPLTGGTTSSNNTYATSQEYIVPQIGVTISFKLPTSIRAIVTHGISATKLIVESEISNGATFTFRNSGNVTNSANTTDNVYRISFRNSGHTSISTSYVEELISNGDIDITYSILDNSTIWEENNTSLIPSMRSNANDHQANYYNQNICIFHASDGHSDISRMKRFFEYSKIIKPDYLILSGDFVNYGRYTNNWSYLNELDENNSIPVFPCIGNHEMNYITCSDAYTTYLKHYVDKYNYAHTGSTTYFYYDDTNYKIRFISVNQNEYDVASSAWKYCISSAQINWFISTLASTPANYSVILVCHMPESMPSYYSSGNYDYSSWFGENQNYDSRNFWQGTGTPLTKIIDAFINKTSISGSYTNTAGGSVSYSANFTSVPSSTDFICWMTGHLHCDCVGYVTAPNSSTKQLMLNITTACAGATTSGDYSSDDNLPRMTYGKTQDAFNVYVINKTNKTIKIARVGSDINRNQIERKFLLASYNH